MSANRSLTEKLLRGTPYEILVRGIDVVLKIKGKELVLHPDTALDMAMGFKHAARLAKKKAGLPPVVHGIADLTDAVADEREIQKSRDGTAVFARAG